MTALLEVSNLSVAFRDGKRRIAAVQDVGFTLAPGERLALMGESGSGKTTIAMAVAGLLPEGAIVSGSVTWPGIVGSAQAGRDIGVVFQDPMSSLNPVLTVGEQIAEVLLVHKGMDWPAANREAVALLDRVGVPEPERRVRAFPHQLSGGQRQRVGIAMAIAAEPRLLVADEPTTALDTLTQKAIVALIDRLMHETGMALLLVTHDLALAYGLVDGGIILRDGGVVERGAIGTLLTAPAHAYTQGLLDASLDIDAPAPDPSFRQLESLPPGRPQGRSRWPDSSFEMDPGLRRGDGEVA
jgi:peptide/nickel transport system ATP-binding protein